MNTQAWQELNLRTPQVRDLYWAVNSPGLQPHPALLDWQDESPWFHQWIADLDQRPQPLLDHLSHSPQKRLGRYFEQLWQFYFQHHRGFELLANNKQLHDAQGRTLGELDLLVRHVESDEIWHLELAVKFYCRAEPGHDFRPERLWVGPKLNDRWDRKLAQLLQSQLPLVRQPSVQRQLQTEQLMPARSFALVKGQLFVPGLCAAGWISSEQLSHLPAERLYKPLAIKEWLCDRVASDDWLTLAQLQQQQGPWLGAQQLAVWHPEQQRQTGRLFVMPPSWAEQALLVSQAPL